ncbi:hypothetical protein FB451DRAFT_1236390 [Mycena latifolia]|nr:hypothetical protein FB451DRAFT_1236390 [Mycena latifolia]
MPRSEALSPIRTLVEAPIRFRIKTLPVRFEEPFVFEHVCETLDAAPDTDNATLLQDARHSLNTFYHIYTNSRQPLPLGCYETVNQLLFTETTYEKLIRRASLPCLDLLEKRGLKFTDVFLFLVAAIKLSLETEEFSAWLVNLLGPLVDAAIHAFVKVSEQIESSAEDNGSPSKKRKVITESRYLPAHGILRRVRVMQSSYRLRRLKEGRAAEKSPLIAGFDPSQTGNSAKSSSPISSYGTADIWHLPALLYETLTTGLFSRSPPTLPRLDPRPPVMPGAWLPPKPPSPAADLPARALPIRHPTSQDPARETRNNYSRFPRRSTSGSYTVQHLVPLGLPPAL